MKNITKKIITGLTFSLLLMIGLNSCSSTKTSASNTTETKSTTAATTTTPAATKAEGTGAGTLPNVKKEDLSNVRTVQSTNTATRKTAVQRQEVIIAK